VHRPKLLDKDPGQPPLFVDPAVELMQSLASLKVDELTPIAAIDLLRAWEVWAVVDLD
jgi:hypothetical protein